MPASLLLTRNRSFSQASIRKRMIKSGRSGSEQHTDRQLIKSSTQTSFRPKLERLIQEGKIQQILNSDKHSKANLVYSSHINDMEKELANSKKALSNMVLKAKEKQLNINKLKNNIARFQKQKEAIEEKNGRVNKQYDQTLQNLEDKKRVKQNAQWNQKSYQFIKERLTKDEFYHKTQYETLQKMQEQERTRSQYIEKKYHEILNQTKYIQNAINCARNISNQQTEQKNEVIDLISRQRQEKQFLYDLRVDKQKRQGEINELSSWVIEKEQMNKYLQILYTHKIVSQIIAVKNRNLMEKYSQVQSAYMNIKSNTNIVEFDKIIKKMEDQDSIYDITVKKVNELEADLNKMQAALRRAKDARNQILSRQGVDIKLDKDYYRGIEKDNYELLLSNKQKQESRNVQDEILKQRVVAWTHRMASKLSIYKVPNDTFQSIFEKVSLRLSGSDGKKKVNPTRPEKQSPIKEANSGMIQANKIGDKKFISPPVLKPQAQESKNQPTKGETKQQSNNELKLTL